MSPVAAWLVAVRVLAGRPIRTAVLLLGYGVGVAVMVALLAVGEGLLAQAQDKDLTSGGDAVVLPLGLDPQVLKVGGVTGMFLSIPNARYVAAQILLGPRYAGEITAVSPELVDKLVYVTSGALGGTNAIPARASAAVPSMAQRTGSILALPEAAWTDAPADLAWSHPTLAALLPSIDRFHVPERGTSGGFWAEWWYFNFATADGAYGYLSFIAGAGREATIALTVVDRQGQVVRWLDRQAAGALPFDGRAFVAGPHAITLAAGRYRIRLNSPTVRADLIVTPEGGAYFPPAEWQSGRLRSGYVVPVLRAAVSGTLRTGPRVWQVAGTAYHDHNWGLWERVTWEWQAAHTLDHALLAGLIRHPALRDPQMFVALYRLSGPRPGLLSVLAAGSPRREAWRIERGPSGRPLRVPGRLVYRARNDAGDTADVEFTTRSVVASPAAGEIFLQLRGAYHVRAVVRGRAVGFDTTGFAETFVGP